MSQNPYKPPNSDLDETDALKIPVPLRIRQSCILFILDIVISVISFIPGIRQKGFGSDAATVIFNLVFTALALSLSVWLIFKILRGKNWARWTMLAYMSIGALFGVPQILDDFSADPIPAVIDSVTLALEGIACWFLFVGEGGAWFGSLKSQSN